MYITFWTEQKKKLMDKKTFLWNIHHDSKIQSIIWVFQKNYYCFWIGHSLLIYSFAKIKTGKWKSCPVESALIETSAKKPTTDDPSSLSNAKLFFHVTVDN